MAGRQPGQGSQFRLPISRPAAQGKVPSLAPVSLRGVKVLIADDNQSNRQNPGRRLGHWHMKVSSASDGYGALEFLEAGRAAGHRIDLVLLDAQMPGMSGFDVAAAIQTEPGLAGPAIMMLSSINLETEAADCRRLGIQRYLVKPVAQSDLQSAILQVLGVRAPLSKAASPVPPPCSSGPALRILLAEDNPINERLAARLLEKMGHTVRSVHNGIEVLAALDAKDNAFDVILMDLQMPEIDGPKCAGFESAAGEIYPGRSRLSP